MTDPRCVLNVAGKLLRPSMERRHLFVYDDLLDEGLLRRRCPTAIFVAVARYDSRRWIINSAGTASIVPRRDHQVHGIVWSVHEIELTALDIQMGVPSQCDRYGSFAKTTNDQLCVSEFYASRNRTFGQASPAYVALIAAAARRWGFPERYSDEITGWATAGNRHADHERSGQ